MISKMVGIVDNIFTKPCFIGLDVIRAFVQMLYWAPFILLLHIVFHLRNLSNFKMSVIDWILFYFVKKDNKIRVNNLYKSSAALSIFVPQDDKDFRTPIFYTILVEFCRTRYYIININC